MHLPRNDSIPPRASRVLDTATIGFSVSPPAERGERGTDVVADTGRGGFPSWRPPLPDPLLQKRRGRSSRRLVAVSSARPSQVLLRFLAALTLALALPGYLASSAGAAQTNLVVAPPTARDTFSDTWVATDALGRSLISANLFIDFFPSLDMVGLCQQLMLPTKTGMCCFHSCREIGNNLPRPPGP